MIGYSLSGCIKDIAKGLVTEGDVEKLVCGIYCPDRQSFAEAVEEYSKNYWFEFIPEAKSIAWRLYDAGKIEQPRLEGKSIPMDVVEGNRWDWQRA